MEFQTCFESDHEAGRIGMREGDMGQDKGAEPGDANPKEVNVSSELARLRAGLGGMVEDLECSPLEFDTRH